jgi:hypothetical protein
MLKLVVRQVTAGVYKVNKTHSCTYYGMAQSHYPNTTPELFDNIQKSKKMLKVLS